MYFKFEIFGWYLIGEMFVIMSSVPIVFGEEIKLIYKTPFRPFLVSARKVWCGSPSFRVFYAATLLM